MLAVNGRRDKAGRKSLSSSVSAGWRTNQHFDHLVCRCEALFLIESAAHCLTHPFSLSYLVLTLMTAVLSSSLLLYRALINTLERIPQWTVFMMHFNCLNPFATIDYFAPLPLSYSLIRSMFWRGNWQMALGCPITSRIILVRVRERRRLRSGSYY
jgi:hypothetical protein